MIRSRWGILAVLFMVRATMAVQLQSVGAVAPLLSSELGFSIADIGILIGLYFAPGVALALPGGAIGQRFGDKTTVIGALALMLSGELLMALTPSWSLQVVGRFGAGAGGVVLSVVSTKMLTDWFAGKEIATAMALGMGLFLTVYNACMVVGTAAAGAIAKWSGSAAAAIDFGAVMIFACPLLMWFGVRMSAPAVRPA